MADGGRLPLVARNGGVGRAPLQTVAAGQAGVPQVDVEDDDVAGVGLQRQSRPQRRLQLLVEHGRAGRVVRPVLAQRVADVRVVRARQHAQRAGARVERVEVGNDLDRVQLADVGVRVPAGGVPVEDPLGRLGNHVPAEEGTGGVHDPRVPEQRPAHRCARSGHRQVVPLGAAGLHDLLGGQLVVGRQRFQDLGAQPGDLVAVQQVPQDDEAVRREEVRALRRLRPFRHAPPPGGSSSGPRRRR